LNLSEAKEGNYHVSLRLTTAVLKFGMRHLSINHIKEAKGKTGPVK
jgi:hypothetical protein